MPLNYVNCSFILILTTLIIGSLIPISKKFNFTDIAGAHKVHTGEIPYLGGVGIVFSLTLFATIYFLTKFEHVNHKSFPYLLVYMMGIIIFIIGLIDDIRGVEFHYKIKLLVQIIAAVVYIAFGPSVVFFGVESVDKVIMFFWIVGITNSFNLLDNMDNFSSGTAVTTAVWLAIVSRTFNAQTLFYFMLLLTIVLIAFMPWNFNPAKIYMGDSGALFVGYCLSAFSLMLMSKVQSKEILNHTILALFMILPAFTIPITDTLSVMVLRIKNKRSPFKGDNNHLSHRLVKNGLSKTAAVYSLLVLNFILGSLSLLIYSLDSGTLGLLIILSLVLLMGLFSVKLGQVHFKD